MSGLTTVGAAAGGGEAVLAESEPIAVTIVFVIALLNFGIRALDQQVKNDSSGLHNATRIIGTLVSGTFLYLIALLNLVVLVSIIKVFREMRTAGTATPN
jgi:high-affinity nickel permease